MKTTSRSVTSTEHRQREQLLALVARYADASKFAGRDVVLGGEAIVGLGLEADGVRRTWHTTSPPRTSQLRGVEVRPARPRARGRVDPPGREVQQLEREEVADRNLVHSIAPNRHETDAQIPPRLQERVQEERTRLQDLVRQAEDSHHSEEVL